MRRLLIALSAVLALLPGVAHADAPNPTLFTLSSPDFANGGNLPVTSTCLGLGLGNPPALRWSGAPAGTREFVLIVTDPQGVTGAVDHWVVYDIPATDTGSAHGQAPAGAKQGLDSFLLPFWLPPCAPGSTPHHYTFTLYALDGHLNLTGLRPPTASQVQTSMTGHILATTRLVGLSALLQ